MADNKRNGTGEGTEAAKGKGMKGLGKPMLRRLLTMVLVLAVLGGGAYLILGQGLISGVSGGKSVKFNQLASDKVPQTIEKDVIPEYRELERALGCLVDGKVYVVVTRGEKPTAGYGVTIEKMQIEKTEQGTNLVVTALFTEPEEGKAVAQVITYPYEVAETELTDLPDTIELRTRFS